MRNFLFTLLRPTYWISNYETCKVTDTIINQLITSNSEVRVFNQFTTKIGKYVVWTGNYPYAYGSIFGEDEPEGLPRNITRKRLKDYIEMKRLEKFENEK